MTLNISLKDFRRVQESSTGRIMPLWSRADDQILPAVEDSFFTHRNGEVCSEITLMPRYTMVLFVLNFKTLFNVVLWHVAKQGGFSPLLQRNWVSIKLGIVIVFHFLLFTFYFSLTL